MGGRVLWADFCDSPGAGPGKSFMKWWAQASSCSFLLYWKPWCTHILILLPPCPACHNEVLTVRCPSPLYLHSRSQKLQGLLVILLLAQANLAIHRYMCRKYDEKTCFHSLVPSHLWRKHHQVRLRSFLDTFREPLPIRSTCRWSWSFSCPFFCHL